MRTPISPSPRIIMLWHHYMGLPKYSRHWHRNDLREEMHEFRVCSTTPSTSSISKLSELSDLCYTASRGHAAGHILPSLSRLIPATRLRFFALAYMMWKYSARFCLYALAGVLVPPTRAAKNLDAPSVVRAVRNPKKRDKVASIAEQHGRIADEYVIMVERLSLIWPLLP